MHKNRKSFLERQGDKFHFHGFHFISDKRWFEQNIKWLLVGIFLLTLSVILGMFMHFSMKSIYHNNHSAWAIATNLVNGRGYTACDEKYFPFCTTGNQTTAMREPIPVLLTAITMWIYPSIKSSFIIQSLLFLGTLLFVYLILKKYDRRLAFLAALLWLLSKSVLTQLGSDTGELASAFFLSVGLYFFMRGMNDPVRILNWALSGFFMGLASLSRTVMLGTSMGLGLFLLLFHLYQRHENIFKSRKENIMPAFFFLTSLLLVYTPWIIRNDMVFGSPVIGSTLTGYNVYRMNSIVANTPFSPHYVGPDDAYTALTQLVHKGDLRGNENEAQMQSVYMSAGLQLIDKHPIQYVELVAYRFLSLWFNASVNAAYRSRLTLVDYIGLIEQAFLLMAVIVGGTKNWKALWPLILILLLGSGAYMLIDAQLRYLVDFMPAVVILAASAFAKLQPITSS